jgi:undecaprenyl-phosphate galactose phosphotransferase
LIKNKGKRLVRKRLFDIAFSLFAIILFMPIMLIIAILIKINSPKGAILFRQHRLGLNGQAFEVLKFRTMVPDAEKLLEELLRNDKEIEKEYLIYRKLKNDVRIIAGIGHFLRKSSLDELPQFFNVFLGNMSVVGPRPYMKIEFFEYKDKIIDEILSVKPGITGYWQVIPTRHNTTFDERVSSDLNYINNRSLWLDFKIIFKTIWIMGLRQGA